MIQLLWFKFKNLTILGFYFILNNMKKNYDGIHIKYIDSINKSDIDIRKELYENIILSGTHNKFKGFNERLKKRN